MDSMEGLETSFGNLVGQLLPRPGSCPFFLPGSFFAEGAKVGGCAKFGPGMGQCGISVIFGSDKMGSVGLCVIPCFFFKLISTTHPPHRARVCLLFPPLRTADMGWAVGLKKGLAGVRRRMERKWAGERKKMFIRSDDGGVGLHWHCHALVQVAVRLLFFPRIASTAR